MSRREALQQASATRCKRSQKALWAYAQGHHVCVVGFGGLSDMLGKKLCWEELRRLQFGAGPVPHVIDRHRFSLPNHCTSGTACLLNNYGELCYGRICRDAN